jgi:hypothetical protein
MRVQVVLVVAVTAGQLPLVAMELQTLAVVEVVVVYRLLEEPVMLAVTAAPVS